MRGPHEAPWEDLHEQLVEILSKLMDSDVIDSDELTLLCIATGVKTRELTGEPA